MDGSLPASNWLEWGRWLLRRRRRMRVTGDSMAPTLAAGDEVFVDPDAFRGRMPQSGEIVVAWHPYRSNTKLVKRVASVADGGDCFLASDNAAEGTDSRSFGVVPVGRLLGKVTSRRQLSKPPDLNHQG